MHLTGKRWAVFELPGWPAASMDLRKASAGFGWQCKHMSLKVHIHIITSIIAQLYRCRHTCMHTYIHTSTNPPPPPPPNKAGLPLRQDSSLTLLTRTCGRPGDPPPPEAQLRHSPCQFLPGIRQRSWLLSLCQRSLLELQRRCSSPGQFPTRAPGRLSEKQAELKRQRAGPPHIFVRSVLIMASCWRWPQLNRL